MGGKQAENAGPVVASCTSLLYPILRDYVKAHIQLKLVFVCYYLIMLTNLQVKAARALLDWDQATLAEASGLSVAAVAGLEQGKGSPRPATWLAVRSGLENAGIEFTPDPGVRLRREKFHLQVFEGHDSAFRIWRDVEECYAKTGGEVLLSGVDERLWIKKYGKDLQQALDWRKKNITTRLLISEGDTVLTGPPEFYRAIPKYLFQQTPYYVYADRMAIINWGPPQQALLIQNPMIAETFRRQFEFNWSIGRKLDPKKVVIAKLT